MRDTPPRLPHKIAVLATVTTAVLAAALYGVLFPIAWQAALDEQITLWHIVLIAIPVTEIGAMVVVPLSLLALGHPGQAARWFLGLLVCSAVLSVLVVLVYATAQAVV
jgi:type IV secretory pathway protease TraF